MAKSVINFTTEWRLVPTTCEPCNVCHDIIYGKQYQLFLNGKPTESKLCEPCRSVIESDTDDTFT